MVWFVQTVDGLKADEIFEAATATEADVVQRNKNLNPLQPVMSSAIGVVDTLQYQVQIQPGRVDLLIQNIDQDDQEREELSNFDGLAAFNGVLARMENGLGIGVCNRLSTIWQLVRPAPDVKSSVEYIGTLTGFEPPVNVDSDLILQVNSKKSFQDFSINRLVRYNTISEQGLLMQFVAGSSVMVPATTIRLATGVMLDFNTVPDGMLFDEAKQITMFKMLGDEAAAVGESCSIETLG